LTFIFLYFKIIKSLHLEYKRWQEKNLKDKMIVRTYEIPIRVFEKGSEKGLPAKVIQDAISAEDAIRAFQENFKNDSVTARIDLSKPILEIPPCPLASKYKKRPMHCAYNPQDLLMLKDLRSGKAHLNCPLLGHPNDRRCAINSAHWLITRYDLPEKTIKVGDQKFSLIRCY